MSNDAALGSDEPPDDVPVLGLATHVAHRLVQQDGHARVLALRRGRLHLDPVGLGHRLAHLRRCAVDADPAALYPLVGLSPRAQTQIGQPLVQPQAGARRSREIPGGSRWKRCGGVP